MAQPTTLQHVLGEVESCADETHRVSVRDVMEAVGTRAYAPLILVPGLTMLAPGLGDIPGVPVLMGLIVILVVGQVVAGRSSIWLPGWVRERSVRADRVRKVVGWLKRPACFIDRWSKPRYTWAVHHGGFVVIGIACITISMATPLMEVVPFSANLAGVVITAFGLALLVQDGLIALVAIALAAATAALDVYHLI